MYFILQKTAIILSDLQKVAIWQLFVKHKIIKNSFALFSKKLENLLWWNFYEVSFVGLTQMKCFVPSPPPPHPNTNLVNE